MLNIEVNMHSLKVLSLNGKFEHLKFYVGDEHVIQLKAPEHVSEKL